MIDLLYALRFPFHCGPFKAFLNKLDTGAANVLMPVVYLLAPTKPLRKPAKDKQLIVSLTTYGERIHSVHRCIQSLMRQKNVPPYRVALWLSETEFSGVEALPDTLRALMKKGLEVYFVEDLRSHKKNHFCAERYPDALMVTADDDFYYPASWLYDLLKTHERYPEAVACHRAHRMTFDQNRELESYEKWDWYADGLTGPSCGLFVLTGAGALYPPRCFDEAFFSVEEMRRYSPTSDDMWVNFTLLRQQIPVCKARPYTKSLIGIRGSQKKTLYQENKGKNYLQTQRALAERFHVDVYSAAQKYPLPEAKKA